MASQQVLAFGVSCKGDGEEAEPSSRLWIKSLGPIHPVLQPRVFDEKAFLVIPDHHVFEDYYIAVTEQYRRLAEQHHNLLLHFYLALASGPDYESAKTLAHDFLTAIITEKTEAATDVVLYIARDMYNSLPPHYRDNYHSSTRMGNITAHRRRRAASIALLSIRLEKKMTTSVGVLISSLSVILRRHVRRPTIGHAGPI